MRSGRVLMASLCALGVLPSCGDETTVVYNSNPTVAGSVVPAAGSGGAAAVFLHVVGADGQILLTRDVAVADAAGAFVVGSGFPASNGTRLLLEAVAGAGSFFRFVTAAAGQRIDPVSTGVFEVVRLIVETPGGRSVTDYTDAEILTINAQAAADLSAAATDLADPVAVRARIIADTGGLIADLSEGSFAPQNLANPVTADPPDLVAASTTFLNLSDGGGQLWDIQSTGSIINGTGDAYDNMFSLSVGGLFFPGQGSAVTQDAREQVLGPAVLSGLNVTRKIYVDDAVAAVSFTRFAEILQNPTAAPIVVNVLVSGNLGSDEGNSLVTNSSSGDTAASGADFWVTNHQDASDPALGFLFPGADTVTKSNDNLSYAYTGVTVPAGGTVVILHWAFQNSGAQPGAVQEVGAILGAIPGPESVPDPFFEGLSQAEVLASFASFAGPGVLGGAGAVAPFAVVTATNTVTGEIVVRTADSDGSFRAIFAQQGASSGELITVTATDGTASSFPFP